MLLMRHADLENVAKRHEGREQLILVHVRGQAGNVYRRAFLSLGGHLNGRVIRADGGPSKERRLVREWKKRRWRE